MKRCKQTPEDCHSRLVMMHGDKGDTWDLSPNDKDAIAWVLIELGRLRSTVRKLGGFAATVRKENTDEWMQAMANALDRACEAIGDSDRFAPFVDGLEKEERCQP